MQLLFPLSLPPLQNASAELSGAAAVSDTRLTQVRVALKAAGLQRGRVISRSAESDSLQNALAHELYLQKQFSLSQSHHAHALVCMADLKAPAPDVARVHEPQGCQWLILPVHFNLALDHLVLAADALDSTQLADLPQWLDLLQEALEPGWTLQAWPSPRGETFFVLSTPATMDWAPKSSIQAMGRSIDRYLPTGQDSRAWRRFLNHTQMLLHEHPLNDARALLGQTSINGFWLEGQIFPSPSNLYRAKMEDLYDQAPTLVGAALVDAALVNTALVDPVVLIDDWIAPTHQGDLDAWTDTWRRFPAFAQSLPKTKKITFNFFGEAAQLSLESEAADRWRLWRMGALI